jgi:hypothetical protein
MTIYERPTKSLMADWARAALRPRQQFKKAEVVRWFAEHYPMINGSTASIHVEVMSTNSPLRKHYPSIKPGSGHDLFYKLDSGEFRLWEEGVDPRPRYKQVFEQPTNDSEDSAANDQLEDELIDQPSVTRKITNQQSNIELLIRDFPRYLQTFERNPPFRRYGQREYHIETIQRRYELGSATKAIQDDQFLDALYRTLQAWGIGVRASKLRSSQQFAVALRAKGTEISALEDKAIDDPQLDVNETGQQLWRLLDSLDIVANNTRIVAGSKTLHHLLPDLMVPIDRAYTQKFFCWPSPKFQYEQEACFEQAFASFAQIARRTNPSQYISGGWHSSRTKVIDNAIVGLISDQQAAVEKNGPQKTIGQTSNTFINNNLIVEPSKPPPMSLIASIVEWCRSLFARRQQ